MAYHWHYVDEGEGFLKDCTFHEDYQYLPDFLFGGHRLEGAPIYTTPNLSTSTTRRCFLQDELDSASHGDFLIPRPALEEGAYHKAALIKGEGSEEALFSPTEYLCTSTSTAAESCLSQDCLLASSEGDHHEVEKDLKQDLHREAGKKKRVWRLSNGPGKPLLTFKLVSQYFCMPVKQAAEELNVGPTHLKRKCRELGIPCWPHRKLKSLETLIKNAQELGKPKVEVEKLQRKKKLIEERPGRVELDQETIVLRQACFKEKFKRRRLMAIQG